jgi:hypothetical protein
MTDATAGIHRRAGERGGVAGGGEGAAADAAGDRISPQEHGGDRCEEPGSLSPEHLGLVRAVTEATTIEELRNITLNVEDA